ncbi:MAG: Ig-like domain-containing protein [Myxococcota bacterium]
MRLPVAGWLALSLFLANACSEGPAPTAPHTSSRGALAAPPERLVDLAPVLDAHAAFRAWLDEYLQAQGPRRPALEARGQSLASARRPLFRALLLQEPELALTMALTPVEHAALPASIASAVESWRDGRGTLHVIGAVAEEPGAPPQPVERFVSFDGEAELLRAGVFGERLGHLTRPHVRLHGVALDGVIALTNSRLRRLFPGEPRTLPLEFPKACPVSKKRVEAAQIFHAGDELLGFCVPQHAAEYDAALGAQEEQDAAAEGLPPASSWTEGPKSVLFIRVDYSDDPGDPISQASAEALINTQVNNFYVANSFGKTSLSATVTPTLRLPKTKAEYQANQNYTLLMGDARTAATAAGYTLSDYQLEIVGFKSTFSGWAGRGYVGGKGTWLNGNFSLRVTAHELGHNYGVYHANFWNAGSTVIGAGSNQEYGNPFDVMGGGQEHFQAWFKRRFDWVTSPEVQVVTASGTHRIHALEQSITSGLHALKVPRDGQKDYWLEFRPAPSNVRLRNGVSINWGYASNTGAHLLDMTPGDGSRSNSALTIGRTFSDPLAGIHLTPVGLGGTTPPSLDVVVNLGAFPGNRAPTVTLAASTLSPAVNGTVTFTATATDADGDPLAYHWDFDDDTLGPNAAVATKTFGAARAHHVAVTVSDMKGKTATASLLVTVGAPTTFTLSGTVTHAGVGLSGVRISDGTRATFTASDGRYFLTNVPGGSYTVTATKTDFTFTRGFAAPLAVSADALGLDFTATPVPGYRIQGRVTAGGAGVAGVVVSDGSRTATTNASGDYTLNDVPTGRYTLSATKVGWQFNASGFQNPLDVMGGNLTNHNFYASGAYLQGTLPASLTTAPTVTDGVRTVTATQYQPGTPWNFFLNSVPNGTWNLVASAPGVTLLPATFTNPVTVSGGMGRSNLDFQVAAGTSYTVAGTVRTGGTPLPGVTVSDGTRSATTDSLGRYVLVGVPSGAYTLTPTLTPYAFVPATLNVTVATANLTGQDFTTTVVNLPPTVSTAAAANPPGPTPATSTQLTVLGADDGGEAALTYSWTATGSYPVSFSANGTNGAKNATATFSGAGTYTLEVTITDAGGLSVRSQVVVQVQQQLVGLAVSPSMANVLAGATQNFTAMGTDQFGRAMFPGLPAWAVSGGGAMSTLGSTGVFTAGTTPGGPHTVTASAGGRTATALVTVTGLGAPTIVVPASATPSAVTGATTQLSVRADDDAGEATLTYQWSTPLAPAPVSFSANGANAAKDTTATFTQPGQYQFLVTVTDTAGNQVTSLAEVTVLATPTRIELQPQVVNLQVGQQQAFTATAEDQFGAPLSPQPAFTWSVTGGGAVDATGTFTAGMTPGGPHALTVTGAGLSATAQIIVGAAPDTQAPTVALTAPAAGARLDGPFTLAAAASDDVGVVKVEFLADGATHLGEVTQPPYMLALDPSALSDGPHVLTARATDAAGNSATSDGLEVVVGQGPVDTTAPSVSVRSPAPGAVTPLSVTLSAEASDDVGVTQVTLELDGATAAEPRTPPWETTVDVAAGPHTVVAIAWDAAGHFTRSAPVSFTAEAAAAPPPMATEPETIVGGCGCAGVDGGPSGLALLLLGLGLVGRRTRALSPKARAS